MNTAMGIVSANCYYTADSNVIHLLQGFHSSSDLLGVGGGELAHASNTSF